MSEEEREKERKKEGEIQCITPCEREVLRLNGYLFLFLCFSFQSLSLALPPAN